MLDDIAVKVERTSDADEVVLIGTDPTDVFEGGAKFKQLARPKLPELKRAAFTLKIEDGPRARLAPDHQSAWVTGVWCCGSAAVPSRCPRFARCGCSPRRRKTCGAWCQSTSRSASPTSSARRKALTQRQSRTTDPVSLPGQRQPATRLARQTAFRKRLSKTADPSTPGM